MYKKQDSITIFLNQDSILIASVRAGEISQCERIELDPESWNESWSTGLRSFDQPLRQLLARFGGMEKKRVADLFYQSPGSICRVEINEQDMLTSVMKMESSLKQTVGRQNPSDAVSLFSGQERSLTLGIADEEVNLQKIFAWLARCNVSPRKMIPSDAVIAMQAMQAAQEREPDSAVLYLSGRSSMIAYSEDGVPKLARLVQIGYDKFAGVYSRTLEQDKGSDDAVLKGRGRNETSGVSNGSQNENGSHCFQGTKLLFEHGIPISKGRGSVPTYPIDVLPSMAPVLQRVCIEIKQTFRFASSLKSTPSQIVICGPGASIPMIGLAMSQNLDMHVDVIDDCKQYKPAELLGEGTIERLAITSFKSDLELLPVAAQDLRTLKSLNTSIRVGAALALAFLVGQFALTDYQSTKVTNALASQSDVIETIQKDQSWRLLVNGMAGSVSSAAGMMHEGSGTEVNWGSLLASLPDGYAQQVQLDEIQARVNSNAPTVILTGMSLPTSTEPDSSAVLTRYINELRMIDDVQRLEIGSTSRSFIEEGKWGTEFVVTLMLKPVPNRFEHLMTIGQAGGVTR
ncbi:MAG: hypothetical protein AB8C13_03680 [Phycisphaerales bacterium]